MAALLAAPSKAESTVQFEDFYRSHTDRLYRALAVTLNNHDLAREAADEAMTRAYMHWSSVRHHDNPGGWVYHVGLNWATSRWRRFRRERPVADPPGKHVHIDHSDQAAYDLIAVLPLPQRSVVVCRILLGLSTLETASALKLTEGTVKSRLNRAMTTLRKEVTA